MIPLKALIFDVDGTLAETEELHRAAFNDTFAAFGLNWHWSMKQYGELLKIAGGKERIRQYLTSRTRAEQQSLADHVLALHREKTKRYTQMIEDGDLVLRPGVERLINEAKHQGILLAIATTTSMPNVTALLRATLGPKATELFSFIGAGDHVARKKPAPDIYDLALSKISVPASQCIAIEDSENGVQAAIRAGIVTVATKSVYTQSDDLTGAISVLSGLGEPDRHHQFLSGVRIKDNYVTVESLKFLRNNQFG